MLKLLFCLTQLKSRTEPKNGPKHAAVSISFLKSDGVELGLTLTGWTLISYIWAIPVFSPDQRDESRADVRLWHVWVWRSGEKVQTHSQVSVCVLSFCFGGQGQTVPCSFGAISTTRVWSDHIRTFQLFYHQSASENMCPSARPLFFF